MTGRRSLIQPWKFGIIGLVAGLGVVFMNLEVCFAAELVCGLNYGISRLENVGGNLPEAAERRNWKNAKADVDMDWEEEFTDTDTRRGILAVRGEVFQGFGGQVRIVVKEMEGGRETVILLTGESDYMANRELRPGRYQVETVEADSDGRKFDCYMESEEMDVDMDKVTMCRVFVRPGSVYQVTEAENETAEIREQQGDILEKGEEETHFEEPEEENALGVVSAQAKDGKRLLMILAVLGMCVSIGRLVQVKRKQQWERR